MKTPEREIVKITTVKDKNTFEIHSEKENTLLSIAALDAYKVIDGEYEERHNLMFMKKKNLKYKVIYPYIGKGIVISLFALILIVKILLEQ